MPRIGFLLLFLLFSPLLLVGCGGGFYQMPQAEYQERVRTLAVLPLMVDEGSTITHPERERVVDLLRQNNAGKEKRLIEILRKEKAYFDVRPVEGAPQNLFSSLVSSRSMRGKGGELYRRYHFNGQAAAELSETNAVDGLLVVILNGVVRSERRWDRKSPSFLDAEYNAVQVTAAVVLPSGEIAWEYPGRRGNPFLPLQYPDFEEAYWNRTNEVKIKFISPEGLDRTLRQVEEGLIGKGDYPALYQDLFRDLAGELKPGPFNPLKSREASPEPVKGS